MQITVFLAAVVAYTCFEIAYWYYHWWHNFRNRGFPTVKSLLWAVLFSHICIALSICGAITMGHATLDQPWWVALSGLGIVYHLIPVWQQQVSNPLSYLFRAVLTGLLTMWIIDYV